MNTLIKKLTLAALLAVVMPAQAAIQSYQFSGVVDSGYYQGNALQGQFSFDDAGLSAVGTAVASLNSLQFVFSGSTFDLATAALSPATVVFQDGVLAGLEWSVDASSPQIGFSFIAGSNDSSDAFFAYDTPLGLSGAASLTYTSAVPEPAQTSMLFAGLGLMWLTSRRRTQH